MVYLLVQLFNSFGKHSAPPGTLRDMHHVSQILRAQIPHLESRHLCLCVKVRMQGFDWLGVLGFATFSGNNYIQPHKAKQAACGSQAQDQVQQSCQENEEAHKIKEQTPGKKYYR